MFEVYQEEKEDDDAIIFMLKKNGDDITLLACDKAGRLLQNGYVCSINGDGELLRHGDFLLGVHERYKKQFKITDGMIELAL